MPEFKIHIANKTIQIKNIFAGAEILCRDYLTPAGIPDICVETEQKDIDHERSLVDGNFSDAYLETIAVHRKICEEMAAYNTFLMHGAVVAVGNSAYMFTAPPGTGKSTHIKLWLDNIPGSFVVNGDKPLIMMKDDTAFACGTPWCGKEGMNTNTIVPLKAIVVLKRGEENEIHKVSPAEYFVPILRQIQRPSDPGGAVRVMKLVEKFMNSLSFYELHCNMAPEAAAVAWEGLRENGNIRSR